MSAELPDENIATDDDRPSYSPIEAAIENACGEDRGGRFKGWKIVCHLPKGHCGRHEARAGIWSFHWLA